MIDRNNKQEREVEKARRFLTDAGFQYAILTASDRPDVITSMNGCSVGIEVTDFHADEGGIRQSNGSPSRQAGEINARSAPNKPYVMSIQTDPHAGLEARISDKIAVAAQYDLSRTDELWLLVSAQQSSFGALAATYVIECFIDINRLNSLLHERLLASRFNYVYWHLMADHAVFGWNESAKWHVVRHGNPPDTSGMDALNMIRRAGSI